MNKYTRNPRSGARNSRSHKGRSYPKKALFATKANDFLQAKIVGNPPDAPCSDGHLLSLEHKILPTAVTVVHQLIFPLLGASLWDIS